MANPKGSENVTATCPEPLAREVEKLAESSGMSRSAYVRRLLEDAVLQGRTFKITVYEVRGNPLPYKAIKP